MGYILTAWETGELPLPPVTIYYQDREGGERTYELTTETIRIRSLLPSEKTREELLALPLKGLKTPVGLPPNWRPLLWFSLIMIGAFLLWCLLHYLQTRFARPATQPEAASAPEPADQIARRRLAALKKAAYLERGDYKGFYSELSAILREYIENRFQITALEMTTDEFLAYLATPDRLSSIPQAAPLFQPEHKQTDSFSEDGRFGKIPAFTTFYHSEADLTMVEELIAERRKSRGARRDERRQWNKRDSD